MYSHDFERETVTTGDAAMAQTAWSSACDQSRLDTEMMIQLRISLCPIFDDATSWSELRSALQAKGFYMKRAKGHMHLYDGHSHVQICTCSFLGYPVEELEQRFKKTAPTRAVRKLPVRNQRILSGAERERLSGGGHLLWWLW